MSWWIGSWRHGGAKKTLEHHCHDSPNYQGGPVGNPLTTALSYLTHLTMQLLAGLVVRLLENRCHDPPKHQVAIDGSSLTTVPPCLHTPIHEVPTGLVVTPKLRVVRDIPFPPLRMPPIHEAFQ